MSDHVDHPAHYTSHPSGVECIAIAEHMNFCLGNALKYIWRAGLKGDELEDLRKARWYLDREIARRKIKESGHGRDSSPDSAPKAPPKAVTGGAPTREECERNQAGTNEMPPIPDILNRALAPFRGER